MNENDEKIRQNEKNNGQKDRRKKVIGSATKQKTEVATATTTKVNDTRVDEQEKEEEE